MEITNMQKKVEEQILDSYEAMYRLAYTYVRNEQDALDIVQESAYKAIKNAGKVKQENFIKTWIWRIVMNTSLDCIRKRKEEIISEGMAEIGKEDKYQDFDTLEMLHILDDKEKIIIVLRFFEDRKLEEIAEVLNENLNTVKSLLYRSLRKLKREMTKEVLA